MKPPYFGESGPESDKKEVMIANVSSGPIPSLPGLNRHKSGPKVTKSDGINGKVGVFLDRLSPLPY